MLDIISAMYFISSETNSLVKMKTTLCLNTESITSFGYIQIIHFDTEY